MAELPLSQAIPRFKSNENRVDIFVNGSPVEGYITDQGVSVPSIRKFLADKDAAINAAAAGILAQATTAAGTATTKAAQASTSAAAAAASAAAAALWDPSSYSTTAQITTILAAYPTTAELAEELGNYSTTAQITTMLGAYSTTAQITTMMGAYSTTAQVDTKIASLAAKASGPLTPTLGGLLTWAHGLATPPVETYATLVCQIAEHGYTVGDETPRLSFMSALGGSTGTWNTGVTTWATETNVHGRIGSSYIGAVMNKTTGVVSPCTLANWKIKLYARP